MFIGITVCIFEIKLCSLGLIFVVTQAQVLLIIYVHELYLQVLIFAISRWS